MQDKVCENVQNSDTFRSSVTPKKFKINWLTMTNDQFIYLHVKHAQNSILKKQFIDKTDGIDSKNGKLMDENFENASTRWAQHWRLSDQILYIRFIIICEGF